MSASLVGSEMCIRDRCRRPLHEPMAPQGNPPGTTRGPTPSKRASPPAAVSYTHLTLPTICSV
eukprot:8088729-Alexandrium_andersonii.AAC.1